MHFVFEIAMPMKYVPVYQKTGPVMRWQWLCFSFAYVGMKYTDFLAKIIQASR